jgi:hypothetical protein
MPRVLRQCWSANSAALQRQRRTPSTCQASPFKCLGFSQCCSHTLAAALPLDSQSGGLLESKPPLGTCCAEVKWTMLSTLLPALLSCPTLPLLPLPSVVSALTTSCTAKSLHRMEHDENSSVDQSCTMIRLIQRHRQYTRRLHTCYICRLHEQERHTGPNCGAHLLSVSCAAKASSHIFPD